jgi:hypothetical protein
MPTKIRPGPWSCCLALAILAGIAGTRATDGDLLATASASAKRGAEPSGATVAAATPETAVAFVGARVIDGTGRPPTESATLLVRDGRVVTLGPSAGSALPAGIRRIDVAGRTIIRLIHRPRGDWTYPDKL